MLSCSKITFKKFMILVAIGGSVLLVGSILTTLLILLLPRDNDTKSPINKHNNSYPEYHLSSCNRSIDSQLSRREGVYCAFNQSHFLSHIIYKKAYGISDAVYLQNSVPIYISLDAIYKVVTSPNVSACPSPYSLIEKMCKQNLNDRCSSVHSAAQFILSTMFCNTTYTIQLDQSQMVEYLESKSEFILLPDIFFLPTYGSNTTPNLVGHLLEAVFHENICNSSNWGRVEELT